MRGLRSFIVTPRLPFPPRSGADLRCWYTVEALRRLGPVGVFGIGSQRPTSPPTTGISVWTSTSLESALDHVGKSGPASWMQIPDWRPSDWYFTPEIADEVAAAAEASDPSLVVLDSLTVAGYREVAGRSPTKVVLNAHNVESDLQRQLAESETSAPAKMVRRRFAERTRFLEEELLGRVDRVWACSQADQRVVTETFPTSPPIDVLPNVIDAGVYNEAYEVHLGRRPRTVTKLVFPAQFAYLPNLRAAGYLMEEVLPALRVSRPEIELCLVGHSPSEWMRRAAAADPGLEVTGLVDDVRPYLTRADAMVLPLFEGSGTRLKALEAMAAGLPMIATAKAVEGLDVEPGRHVLIAERLEDFIGAIRQLDHPETYGRLVREGRNLVERSYSPGSLERAVRRSVDAIFG